jgi:hypothetical protein
MKEVNVMPTTAAALAPIAIVDDRDAPVVIGSAWQERPALLVFIRHFG